MSTADKVPAAPAERPAAAQSLLPGAPVSMLAEELSRSPRAAAQGRAARQLQAAPACVLQRQRLAALFGPAAPAAAVLQGVFTQTGSFTWLDAQTNRQYQQTQVRVDNRIRLSGHGESFDIVYANGKWERVGGAIEQEAPAEEMQDEDDEDDDAMLPDSDEASDADHPAGGNEQTETLFPEELDAAELKSIPGHESILKDVFQGMLDYYKIKVHHQELMDDFFARWEQGVHTRGWWQEQKRVIEESSKNPDTKQTKQLKRTPGTYSYQAKYTTENFGKFKDVTYLRDDGGNINFSKPTKKKAWKDPIKATTHVKLNTGMKDKRYGIMGGGQKIQIAGASRSVHFSIGDRLSPWAKANRAGAWTWHHLSKEYEMVLVDMVVHQKHGHNGGMLIWK